MRSRRLRQMTLLSALVLLSRFPHGLYNDGPCLSLPSLLQKLKKKDTESYIVLYHFRGKEKDDMDLRCHISFLLLFSVKGVLPTRRNTTCSKLCYVPVMCFSPAGEGSDDTPNAANLIAQQNRKLQSIVWLSL